MWLSGLALAPAAGPEQVEEPAPQRQLGHSEEEGGEGEERANHVQRQQEVQDLQGDAGEEVSDGGEKTQKKFLSSLCFYTDFLTLRC